MYAGFDSLSSYMRYEIWSEGYRTTGQLGGVIRHGTCEGRTFKEACINFRNYHSEFKDNFDPINMTFWGCRLFDNEEDARKAFG